MSEYCVICGMEIPEGVQVCLYCERKVMKGVDGSRLPSYGKKIKIKKGKKEKR